MVKTNAEKQTEYRDRIKAKQNSDYLKKDGKKKSKERGFEEIPCLVSRL